jgi:hypothetical protein
MLHWFAARVLSILQAPNQLVDIAAADVHIPRDDCQTVGDLGSIGGWAGAVQNRTDRRAPISEQVAIASVLRRDPRERFGIGNDLTTRLRPRIRRAGAGMSAPGRDDGKQRGNRPARGAAHGYTLTSTPVAG